MRKDNKLDDRAFRYIVLAMTTIGAIIIVGGVFYVFIR